MAGFGIGGFGIGEFGIGGLTTGVGSLTTSTKQVVWRSDMIVTAGFTAIFDATYQVTVHTDCQSAVGTGGLTIASDDAIILTGTPLVANTSTASLSITSSAVSYNSTPIIQPSLTSLTFSPLPTTIIGTANLYPSAVALATNTEQVSTVIDQVITTQLGGQASQSFQVGTILGHNLSVGATSLTIAEQVAEVVTDVKVYPNASSLGSSVGYQPSLSIGNAISLNSGTINTTGNTVNLKIGNAVSVGTKTLNVIGQQPSLSLGCNIDVGLGNQLTVTGKQVSKIIDQNISVGFTSLFDAEYQVSLVIGNTIGTGLGTLAIEGKQSNLRIDNNIPVGLGNQLSIGSAAQTIEFAITVAPYGGINVFYVDGVANPVLTLIKGNKYIFDQSHITNSGHPLRFKDSAGNSYTSGSILTGLPGQAGAKIEVTIASDAPSNLRYYCTVHGNGMGNAISVLESLRASDAYPPSLIIGNTLNVSNSSLSVAVKSTSLNVGINANSGVGTLPITGKQTNLRIGNTIPLNLGSYQFTTLAPLPLTGSFEPAGRTIAPQRQSRQLVASFLSADGNDLVVTKIAQEQSRKISQQVNDQNGNDVQRVA